IGFIALFAQFIAPIKTFSSAISRIQKGIVSYQRIKKLLLEEKPISESDEGIKIHQFHQELKVEGLYFQYENKNKYALENINFTLKKGETLALVGPSGGGKSTLVDLICRFYEPTKGQIFIDGIPLNQIHAGSFRNIMGIVTQEGILFHDTVANNIAYANPVATRQEIIHAAKIANAHDFIMQLPHGYDTVIGERGTMLSGGQRQRIAIARAILKNPQLLILDEATSALDNESEKLVQDALNHLMKDRTSIVIAHRLSTVIHADKILVIEEGKIVESGNHEELLQKNGLYAKLYQLQFSFNNK
ncbi:MAG: ATP-binding cassette domain-containing protein, partial [Candidatus Pacearchaeota archaeon]